MRVLGRVVLLAVDEMNFMTDRVGEGDEFSSARRVQLLDGSRALDLSCLF